MSPDALQASDNRANALFVYAGMADAKSTWKGNEMCGELFISRILDFLLSQ